MKLIIRFLAAAALSVCIAWALSYLPELNDRFSGKHGELRVFENMKPIVINDENIVDWILTAPLHLELKRVDWSHNILSVDFESGKSVKQPEAVYEQLLDFVYYGFIGTTNVERVWVRIVQTADGDHANRKQLLLAVDARREQISTEIYNQWKQQQATAEQLIRGRFQLTVTPQWRRLLPESVQ